MMSCVYFLRTAAAPSLFICHLLQQSSMRCVLSESASPPLPATSNCQVHSLSLHNSTMRFCHRRQLLPVTPEPCDKIQARDKTIPKSSQAICSRTRDPVSINMESSDRYPEMCSDLCMPQNAHTHVTGTHEGFFPPTFTSRVQQHVPVIPALGDVSMKI